MHILTIISLYFFNTMIFAKTPLCQLVEHHAYVSTEKSRFNNGYPKERYHEVLNKFISEFTPDIESRQGTFHILRDWSDGAVNAWAWRIGDEYWIEAPGGLSRYHLINEEGFITTLCHELGHLLGGKPMRNDISFEGQADYYSTSGCLERMLVRLKKPHEFRDQIKGPKSLTSYYAELAKVPAPRLDTPDQNIVSQTLRSHPTPQCRFDTMIAALEENSRPRCWFKP